MATLTQETPRGRQAWLAAPAFGFVLVFLILPLLLMLRFSFNRFVPGELMQQAFTLANYAKFFTDRFYQEVLWTTVWTSAVSAGVCLLLGYPLAYAIARTTHPRRKSLLIIAIVVPLLMGNAVRTAAWMVILGDSGILSAIVKLLGGPDHWGLMYTATGEIIAMVSILLPFMILTLQSVLEGVDTRLEEAATSLGATRWRGFVEVVLPLSVPGIITGTLLCFILSMNAYATPVLVGGPQFHMMAPAVYDVVSKAMNWPFGAALAFILMIVTLALAVLATVLGRRLTRRWAA